tara:strand:+ start:54 stop:905 length:852 start_codon:yes stop_codon:yes gene_type:complete
MNVLSLFDGMSCGQIALDQLGIKVDNYFASEIDSKAIEVVAKNYPNTKQLGDVTNIRYSGNHKIDLLIGGSPCQSFSSLGDGTGLNGKSGLFYEFVRLLNEVKPTYFLLENVVMKKEYQDIISIELGVKPVAINSKHFTGQNRPRLYWTNIPNIDTYEKTEVDGIIKDFSFWEKVEPTPFVLNKVKEMDINSNFINPYNKSSLVSTFPNLTAQGNSQTKSSSVIRLEGNDFYMANLRHWCVLQGVPYEYMQGLSESQGKTLLGNGWTVDVIKHIFKQFKEQLC